MAIVALLTGFLTLVGFGGGYWLSDLASHFRGPYLLVQGLLLVGLLALKRWRSPVNWVLLPGLLANLWLLAPYWLTQPGAVPPATAPRLTLLHMNIFAPNPRIDAVVTAIHHHNPDVLELMEYSESARQALEQTGVLAAYPHRVTGKAHIGIYSRLPLEQARWRYVGDTPVANFAQLAFQLRLGDRAMQVIVAHPHWPLRGNWERQGQHVEAWLAERPDQKGPTVVVGDLNMAPWSHHFRRLLAGTTLRDSQRGFGVQASWPVFVPGLWRQPAAVVAWLGIPIDHVLVSPEVYVWRRQVGPETGSDHLPVFVELGLR